VTRTSIAPGIGAGFSVAGALADYDDDRLARLLRARPDLATPPPDDLAGLATRAANWASVIACVRRLNQVDRQVLEALRLLPKPATVAQLAALLGDQVDPTDLGEPLERLADRGLVFREGQQVRLLATVEQLVDPARLGPPLHEVLGRRTVQEVSEIARRIGVRPRSPKAALLDAVAEVLADPSQVRTLLARAPAQAAGLAERLATETPRLSAPDLYVVLHHRKTAETPVAWLVGTGMLVPTDWDSAVMPREVGLALRGGRPFPGFAVQPPPVLASGVDPDQADRAAAARALRVVADVAALLDEWGERPAKLLKSGGVGVREVRRAASVLGCGETEAARIVELAGVARLVAEDVDAGSVMPSSECDDWLALPAPARWSRVVSAWVDAHVQLACAGAADSNGKPIPPPLHRESERDARERRRPVLDALSRVEPGHAPELEALQRRIRWEAPGLWEGGPAAPATLVGWVIDEAELLGLTANGALSTAGRLAASGDADAAATALARWAPAVTTRFVVQADLTAVATGDLDGAVRRELDLLADVESKGAATVYRFSEASVRRAFDAGRTAAETEAFLDRHAERGVPQPLRYLVADIGRRHGRVRVGTARCYLRCDDPALLAEIVRVKKTASLGLRQLAPTVLLSDATPEQLLDTLRKAGYLPVQETPDGAVVEVRHGPRRAPAPRARGAGAVAEIFGDDPMTAALLRAHPELLDQLELTPRDDGVAPLDPAEIVARLRRAPVATPDVPAAGAQDAVIDNVLPLFSPTGEPNEACARPTDIARGRDSVRMLLGWACEEDWLVRIGVTNDHGATAETYAAVLEVTRSQLVAQALPLWDTRTFALDRIAWARVTTEAEEDRLL
jgi:hypothetical protein